MAGTDIGPETLDMDFPLLRSIIEGLDPILIELHEMASKSPDPDGWGILDKIESLAGLCLVACQNYMITRLNGRPRSSAYACGPKCRGSYVAEIINAAANYHKHHPEWEHEDEKKRKATVDVLRALGVWEYDYKASRVLDELIPYPATFRDLLPLLDGWREALDPGGFVP